MLIEAVADLVQDAEKCVVEVVFIESGGDPAIPGPNTRTKRMGGHVEPAAPEVKAYCGSHGLAKDSLPLAWVKASEDRVTVFIRKGIGLSTFLLLALSRFGNGLDQGNQVATEFVEEYGQLGTIRSRFVLVEQRIV